VAPLGLTESRERVAQSVRSMIFSPGPLLSQPPGSCFPDPNSHNWCKAIQEAKIAAKKDAAYLETRDKAAADYLPKSHSWCKTIQKAKIASKKDAAYLEARDNAAADYETSALPYRSGQLLEICSYLSLTW